MGGTAPKRSSWRGQVDDVGELSLPVPIPSGISRGTYLPKAGTVQRKTAHSRSWGWRSLVGFRPSCSGVPYSLHLCQETFCQHFLLIWLPASWASPSEFFFYCAFYEAAFCSLPVAPTYPHGIINNNTREERRRLFILPFLHPFLHHHPNAFLRQDANVKTLLETSRAAFSHTAEVQ